MTISRTLIAFLTAASLVAAGAAAQSPGRTERPATVSYGSDKAQQLDLYRARGTAGPAPLILFVHGGGWTNGSKGNATGRHMAPHYTALGYHFATIDYRLVPDATVEQQAQDVAAALKHLLGRAGSLGIDPGKVVLMGHSAGAHLVALVGTDPQYLRRAGLSYQDVDGVIPLDGAAYDVAQQMKQSRLPLLKRRYDAAFGKDPARQCALSPISQAADPNAANWLILHVDRVDGRQQSQDLARALRRAGAEADLREFEGKGMKGHMEINRRLGDPAYPATPVVDAFLARLFG
jgi:arylformamidase